MLIYHVDVYLINPQSNHKLKSTWRAFENAKYTSHSHSAFRMSMKHSESSYEMPQVMFKSNGNSFHTFLIENQTHFTFPSIDNAMGYVKLHSPCFSIYFQLEWAYRTYHIYEANHVCMKLHLKINFGFHSTTEFVYKFSLYPKELLFAQPMIKQKTNKLWCVSNMKKSEASSWERYGYDERLSWRHFSSLSTTQHAQKIFFVVRISFILLSSRPSLSPVFLPIRFFMHFQH